MDVFQLELIGQYIDNTIRVFSIAARSLPTPHRMRLGGIGSSPKPQSTYRPNLLELWA
jgi:hypothetical protein